MTAIVTADKLVNALAGRISAGTSVADSGPNKQLKDAMVAKGFFQDTGGGGGSTGGMKLETATATMIMRPNVRAMTPATVTRESDFRSTDVANPNGGGWNTWNWDSVSANPPTMGSWVGKTKFTFAKDTLAMVSLSGYFVFYTGDSSPAGRVKNLLIRLATSHPSLPNGAVFIGTNGHNAFPGMPIYVGADGVSRIAEQLTWATGAYTCLRAFKAGETLEVKYLASSLNGSYDMAWPNSVASYGASDGLTSDLTIFGFM